MAQKSSKNLKILSKYTDRFSINQQQAFHPYQQLAPSLSITSFSSNKQPRELAITSVPNRNRSVSLKRSDLQNYQAQINSRNVEGTSQQKHPHYQHVSIDYQKSKIPLEGQQFEKPVSYRCFGGRKLVQQTVSERISLSKKCRTKQNILYQQISWNIIQDIEHLAS
ncbi:hypothetical protein FGO68_gene13159 [Halteria grandinella]|uniref:Uncharacterized protein n=1 Tax=Halteria grandinella TaxID=5974 RepID=A0A8J8T1C6_HALGN|nr:hypothetical protein FGO68_gene13159 [Halteria grandinella]